MIDYDDDNDDDDDDDVTSLTKDEGTNSIAA